MARSTRRVSLGFNRRDFLRTTVAIPAGVGAGYFAYQRLQGGPVRSVLVGAGKQGREALIRQAPVGVIQYVGFYDVRPSQVELAKKELAQLGLVDGDAVQAGYVVRVPKAYPIYDEGYEDAVAVLRAYLAGFDNLETFGRNGLHRYNNQDHSMWTAILATLNLIDRAGHDVWSVNVEAEYHEEGEAVDAVLDLEPVT